jgi:hypothetical protein
MLMSSPSSTNSTPLPPFTFNSSGGANSTYRPTTGDYRVTFAGVGAPGGNVQVSNKSCHPVRFRQAGADEVVVVRCYDPSGALMDTSFAIAFTDGQGLKPPGNGGVAYVTANRPTAAHYTPSADHRFQTNGLEPTIDRLRKGRYLVTLRGMNGGGAAQVTTYSFGTTRCAVAKLPGASKLARIQVDCQGLHGSPKDAKFGLQYTN